MSTRTPSHGSSRAHGSSPARRAARVLPVGVDDYMRSAAAFLASRLAACSGVAARDNFDGVESFGDGRIESDYPAWYSTLTTGPETGRGSAFDGALLRDALASMARGETPRMTQREARYMVDRINAARASGDRELELPPQYVHGGGGARGVKQARLRVDRGEIVERVPLRLSTSTMGQLREAAAARGVSINALAAAILEAALHGAPGSPAHGSSVSSEACAANDANDPPF